MEESKRQKQVAGLLNEELSDIFLRLGINMIDGGMISISNVKVTPDLMEARVYLSFFQIPNPKEVLKKIDARSWEVKKMLTSRVRHQLRIMPFLSFFHDDTLDHVFKMEDLLNKVKADDESIRKDNE